MWLISNVSPGESNGVGLVCILSMALCSTSCLPNLGFQSLPLSQCSKSSSLKNKHLDSYQIEWKGPQDPNISSKHQYKITWASMVYKNQDYLRLQQEFL